MKKKTHINPTIILTNSNHILKYGSYGFKILTNLKLTKNHLISIERILSKKLKSLSNYSNGFKFWTLISLNKTLTRLPLESRMGKGKGAILTVVVFLRKGSIIYEFKNLNSQQIKQIFSFLSKYISAKSLLISKK